MAECKCGKPMRITGDKWLCTTCGCMRDIPYKTPSHEDALEEIEKLKQEIRQLRMKTVEQDIKLKEIQEILDETSPFTSQK